ncbi:general odorant-binding protein 71 [Periplaneta americana]|uniref:general odorant-binding protein 71 n=1 Tax=Periplaneta americana TaxID=6978 RepID=UPI0037E94C43
MNNSYKNNTNTSSDVLDGSPLEKVDACVIYCIFHEMKMLDSSDLPDKGKVSRVMLKKVRDPQMRDFIEESVDDCFELLDSDNKRDSCEYSKNLALCLEERGRRNCDDWDDQSEAKSSNNRNSKNPKRAT